MEGEEERSSQEGSFSELPVPKRIAIVVAGALVNIIFGLAVYFVLYASIGTFLSNEVDYTLEGYSAESIGIESGDKIIKVNDKKIRLSSDITEIVGESEGNTLEVTIERDGEEITYDVIPTEVESKSIGIYLGTEGDATTTVQSIYEDLPAEKAGVKTGDTIISINGEEAENDYNKVVELIQNSENEVKITVERDGEIIDFEIEPEISTSYYIGVAFKVADKTFANNIYYAFWQTIDFCGSIGTSLKELFTGNVGADQMMGPIGISSTVASTTSIEDFVYLLAVISVSLGVTNLLPIPALDGGKILILIIEGIRRKPLSEKLEIGLQLAGFSCLMLLCIYVSYNDVIRLL